MTNNAEIIRYLKYLRKLKPAYAPNFSDEIILEMWAEKLGKYPLESLLNVCRQLKAESTHLWPDDLEHRVREASP